MRSKVAFFYSNQQILRPEEVNLNNMTLCYQTAMCCIKALPDEVILGCQHLDVYSATVDGIR